MSVTADNLRDLHELHRRARALRDKLTSDPKTLSTRRTILDTRRGAVDTARKALQEERARAKNRESLVQSQQARIEDFKAKLNQVKKNEEYKAIQNQIAHDKAAVAKLEDELLETYAQIEKHTAELAALEGDVKTFDLELGEIQKRIDAQSSDLASKLAELETAIVEAENIIPVAERDRYRRVVKHRGADALAAVEGGACSGCFVSVTGQMMNELINVDAMVFCNTCGRVLYLAEEAESATKRR